MFPGVLTNKQTKSLNKKKSYIILCHFICFCFLFFVCILLFCSGFDLVIIWLVEYLHQVKIDDDDTDAQFRHTHNHTSIWKVFQNSVIFLGNDNYDYDNNIWLVGWLPFFFDSVVGKKLIFIAWLVDVILFFIYLFISW